MMGLIAPLLAFFSGIVKGVLIDAFKTPATITEIKDVATAIDTPVTTDDELLSQFGGMLDRD